MIDDENSWNKYLFRLETSNVSSTKHPQTKLKCFAKRLIKYFYQIICTPFSSWFNRKHTRIVRDASQMWCITFVKIILKRLASHRKWLMIWVSIEGADPKIQHVSLMNRIVNTYWPPQTRSKNLPKHFENKKFAIGLFMHYISKLFLKLKSFSKFFNLNKGAFYNDLPLFSRKLYLFLLV